MVSKGVRSLYDVYTADGARVGYMVTDFQLDILRSTYAAQNLIINTHSRRKGKQHMAKTDVKQEKLGILGQINEEMALPPFATEQEKECLIEHVLPIALERLDFTPDGGYKGQSQWNVTISLKDADASIGGVQTPSGFVRERLTLSLKGNTFRDQQFGKIRDHIAAHGPVQWAVFVERENPNAGNNPIREFADYGG